MKNTMENGVRQARLKIFALILWRSVLLSVIGIIVGSIFKVWFLWKLSGTVLGITLGIIGWKFLFQSRGGFTFHDNRMANLVGSICLLMGSGILAWVWL